jgi:hypothetical protein
LEVAGWQLPHPVVHPDQAIGYPSHHAPHRGEDSPKRVSPPPASDPTRRCASSPTSLERGSEPCTSRPRTRARAP